MKSRENLILIVDDEPDMCWALEHLLHKQGLCTKAASSGQGALELLQVHHFAAAFLDAKLADMDGLELAGLILKIDPDIKIVMVSGYFYRDDIAIQTAVSQGLITGFISKPFLQGEILKALKPVRQNFSRRGESMGRLP
jgi:DNA-binding NtrC family response regulator